MDSVEFYIAAVCAVLVAAVSKGGFGGGLVVMAVPILSLVIEPAQAAAILLPLLLAMDAVSVRAFWGQWDNRILWLTLPAATAGILGGWLVFHFLDGNWIRLLVGGIAVLFTMKHWGWLGKIAQGKKPGDREGRFWGGVAGFTSFVAHAGGPPISMYLLPLQLEKTLYVATTIFMFAVINTVKLVPYYFLNQLSGHSLWTSLWLLPVAVAGTQLGVWLHDRIRPDWFYRICYVLLFITGWKLIADGFQGIFA
jgi:uncharacterized membrane protein YfcA